MSDQCWEASELGRQEQVNAIVDLGPYFVRGLFQLERVADGKTISKELEELVEERRARLRGDRGRVYEFIARKAQEAYVACHGQYERFEDLMGIALRDAPPEIKEELKDAFSDAVRKDVEDGAHKLLELWDGVNNATVKTVKRN